jgi:hypothetical protein
MATATGKAARARYGNRFAAKRRRDKGSKRQKSRRTWGKLAYSVAAGNAPAGAVSANENLVGRIFEQRRDQGWEDDANVSVPGPTRESVMARRAAEEKLRPKRRREDDEDDDGELIYEERY